MEEKQIEVADGKTMNFKPSDVCGTLLTNSNFTGAGVQLIKEQVNRTSGHRQPLIWERYNNKALNETLATNQVESGDFIDAYNRAIQKDIAGTITTRVSDSNQTFIADKTGEALEKQSYRIRKLTPKECGRLMGVKDEDIDKMSVNQSNSKLYHLYGDAICVPVLSAIFEQML